MLDVVLGIDYGTSNTVALVQHRHGKTRPLLFDSSPLLPSAVFAGEDGQLLVGRDAEHSARLDPARFEPYPKRRIDDLEVLLGTQAYPTTALVAASLTRIRVEAERVVGGPVDAVIMTYPATWGTARRQVLVEAAAAARLPAPRLVAEPVAAATYFATVLDQRIGTGQCVVVYDLGAGTFDVSVVQKAVDGFRELSYRGLDDAGGVDLDALVVGHARSIIEPGARHVWQRLASPRDDADRRHARMLWTDARHLRERLSRESSASMFVPMAEREVLLTRQQFEALAQPLLHRTVQVTVETVRQARVRPAQLVGWFLVGGASRTPLIATLLHRATGTAPVVLEEPQLVVAEGALCAAGFDAALPQSGGGGVGLGPESLAELPQPARPGEPPPWTDPSWPTAATPLSTRRSAHDADPAPAPVPQRAAARPLGTGYGELSAAVAGVFAVLLLLQQTHAPAAQLIAGGPVAAGTAWRIWRMLAPGRARADWPGVVVAGVGTAGLLVYAVLAMQRFL